jgi:hypothetical protein
MLHGAQAVVLLSVWGAAAIPRNNSPEMYRYQDKQHDVRKCTIKFTFTVKPNNRSLSVRTQTHPTPDRPILRAAPSCAFIENMSNIKNLGAMAARAL